MGALVDAPFQPFYGGRVTICTRPRPQLSIFIITCVRFGYLLSSDDSPFPSPLALPSQRWTVFICNPISDSLAIRAINLEICSTVFFL